VTFWINVHAFLGRLNTIDASREIEYQTKIASLEQKVGNLMRTQQQLEMTIESLQHTNNEEELKATITALERSERALHRKIEILQVSDGQHNKQVRWSSFSHLTLRA